MVHPQAERAAERLDVQMRHAAFAEACVVEFTRLRERNQICQRRDAQAVCLREEGEDAITVQLAFHLSTSEMAASPCTRCARAGAVHAALRL